MKKQYEQVQIGDFVKDGKEFKEVVAIDHWTTADELVCYKLTFLNKDTMYGWAESLVEYKN